MARRIEKLRDQDTAELSERQNELAEQVIPAALSALHRAGRGGHQTALGPKRSCARQDAAARARIEEATWQLKQQPYPRVTSGRN